MLFLFEICHVGIAVGHTTGYNNTIPDRIVEC